MILLEHNRGMHKTCKNYFKHMRNAQGQAHRDMVGAYMISEKYIWKLTGTITLMIYCKQTWSIV